MNRSLRALATYLTGGLVALATLGLHPSPAAARWLQADTALFTIYSDGIESELRRFAQSLHDFDALVRQQTRTHQATSPNRLTVFLVAGPIAMQQILT